MSELLGYIFLILWLFVIIAPFVTYHGVKRIINDSEIKKIDEYSVELFSGLFPYRKRLRWIAKNHLSFPHKLKKYASRIVAIDRLTIAAIIVLFVVYVLTVISNK